MAERITVKLIGENGNIFNLMGIASKALKRAGQGDKAREMQAEVTNCISYESALDVITKYVDVE